MEDYGIVIDYLPTGKPTDIKREPIAYLVGERYFTLLEAVAKRNVEIKLYMRVYIGKDLTQRKEIERIKGKVEYNQLTGAAKNELKTAIKKIIQTRENDFINFINKCGSVTIRQHQLELLPGIGKKHLDEILKERETKPFESFEDITKRIPHLMNPVDIIAERVIMELSSEQRYYLFTKPPVPQGYGERKH
jgi:putative nucleotide binding protein